MRRNSIVDRGIVISISVSSESDPRSVLVYKLYSIAGCPLARKRNHQQHLLSMPRTRCVYSGGLTTTSAGIYDHTESVQ